VITTYAGTETNGLKDGPASEAKVDNPTNLAVDAQGNLYVADAFNNRFRKINKQ